MSNLEYESHDYLCYTDYKEAKIHADRIGGVPQQIFYPDREESDAEGNVWIIAEKEILPGDSNILCLRENGFWL